MKRMRKVTLVEWECAACRTKATTDDEKKLPPRWVLLGVDDSGGVGGNLIDPEEAAPLCPECGREVQGFIRKEHGGGALIIPPHLNPDRAKERQKGKTFQTPEEFWEAVRKTETCWVWLGSKDPDGRGKLVWKGKHGTTAARVAWELVKGTPVPDNKRLLNECGTAECVNPEHYRQGGEERPPLQIRLPEEETLTAKDEHPQEET